MQSSVYCYTFAAHRVVVIFFFFFFNDTATTEIYTLSLHDALPISTRSWRLRRPRHPASAVSACATGPTWSSRTTSCRGRGRDRKSTRLNSSHSQISYAVFCLKKKKKTHIHTHVTSNHMHSECISNT